MVFISFINLRVVQNSGKVKSKLSSDGKISSSLISNNCASCFNRIDFIVIPSYIELPWVKKVLQIFDNDNENFKNT